MNHLRVRLEPILAVLISAPILAQSPVIVVDAAGGPGAQYTKLENAVESEPDATIFLLRPGVYPTAFLTRPVSVFGDTSAGTVTIEGIGMWPTPVVTGTGFVFRGLHVKKGGFPFPVGFSITVGPAWIEDCVTSTDGNFTFNVRDGASAAIVRHQTGGNYNAHALTISAATVSIYDSVLVGTDSCNDCPFQHAAPENAIRALEPTSIFASGCTLEGGAGPTGGPAVLFEDPVGSILRVIDTEVLSGSPTGEPVLPAGFDIDELGGAARSMQIPAVVNEGSVLVETFRGVPGDLVFLGFSLSQVLEPQFDASLTGTNFLGPLVSLTYKGIVPASGELESLVQLNTSLGLGSNGFVLYMQSAFLTSDGAAFLSNPTAGLLKGSMVD